MMSGHLEFYWTAFQRLSSCRNYGPSSVGPVPWTAMDQYADRYGITFNEYDDFITIMEGLDQVFLSNQPKTGKNGGKNKGK